MCLVSIKLMFDANQNTCVGPQHGGCRGYKCSVRKTCTLWNKININVKTWVHRPLKQYERKINLGKEHEGKPVHTLSNSSRNEGVSYVECVSGVSSYNGVLHQYDISVRLRLFAVEFFF